jgi:hypothetical protein
MPSLYVLLGNEMKRPPVPLMTLISRTIVVEDNGCIGFDQFLVGWMILTSVICMFAPGGKPRYRLKMAHLYTPAGAMGQGRKNQIHGDYFRRIFDRRLELRRSPRNRVAEVVIFLSAYKS